MDFLKKHYEKILLGVMLAGLIGVLVFMLFYIASDKADMANKRDSLTNPHVKALTNLDMTVQDSAIIAVEILLSPGFGDDQQTAQSAGVAKGLGRQPDSRRQKNRPAGGGGHQYHAACI